MPRNTTENQHTYATSESNAQPVRQHPYPPEITNDPRWRRLWDFLLSPTPEEIEAANRGDRAA